MLKGTFTVPIFPHVKKFLAHRYGLKSPIKVSENISLGKIVTLSLIDKRQRTLSRTMQRDAESKINSELVLVLTEDQVRMGPRINKLIAINTDIDQIFKEHLITYIMAQKSIGIPVKTACRSFLAEMGINESEYSIDAAYKHWQRTTTEPLAKEGLVG